MKSSGTPRCIHGLLFAVSCWALACSSNDDRSAPGDAGAFVPPVLPADCDQQLPEAALFEYPLDPAILTDVERIRAFGDTVYYRAGAGVATTFKSGIYAVTVPGGTPVLIGSEPDGVWFQDLWVEDSDVFAASVGALYRIPRTGGQPVLVSGQQLAAYPSGSGPYYADAYARADGYVFYSAVLGGYPNERTVIYRLPWSGGTASEFVTFQGSESVLQFVSFAGALVYESYENLRGSWWSQPVAGGDPTPLPKIRALLAADVNLYVITVASAPKPYTYGISHDLDLSRLVGTTDLKALKVPENVQVSYRAFYGGPPRSAYFNGDTYLVMDAVYRASAEAGSAWNPVTDGRTFRNVLVRIRPDADAVEILRCIPAPSGDPPPDSQAEFLVPDITASESGVFVLRYQIPGSDYDWHPVAIKVWP